MHAMSAPVILYPMPSNLERRTEKPVDLTDLHFAETAKLLSLGIMAKKLSHEFNSPLSLLMVKLENLSNKIASRSLTEELLETELSRLTATPQRLAKVSKALRAINSESPHAASSIFFLSQSIEQAIQLNLERLNRYGIQLNQSVPSHLLVEGRPGDVSHGIYNLLSDCIEALTQISEPCIWIEGQRTNSCIRIEIKDNRRTEEKSLRTEIPMPLIKPAELLNPIRQIPLAVAAEIFQSHGGRFYSDFQLAEHTFVLELPDFQKAGPISGK